MSIPEIRTFDKSTWGEGPWHYEPDRLEFRHCGLPCILVRGPVGNWCGYVGVTNSHPAYRIGYDDVVVEVHGGLTYSEACNGAICHVPRPDESDDVWWLGFDCAHSGDYSPTMGSYRTQTPPYDHARALLADSWRVDQYRTLEYTRAQTERLAEQLAAQEVSS